MPQQKTDEDNRRALRLYCNHALDELQLMQLHAKALCRDAAAAGRVDADFEDVRMRIAVLGSMIGRGAGVDVPAEQCDV